MTEEERDEIEDQLPYRYDVPIWEDEEELPHFGHANLAWWLEAMGHPKAHRGCCKTCGCATTCTASAFYSAVVTTTLRQLDAIGALVKPAPEDARTSVSAEGDGSPEPSETGLTVFRCSPSEDWTGPQDGDG